MGAFGGCVTPPPTVCVDAMFAHMAPDVCGDGRSAFISDGESVPLAWHAFPINSVRSSTVNPRVIYHMLARACVTLSHRSISSMYGPSDATLPRCAEARSGCSAALHHDACLTNLLNLVYLGTYRILGRPLVMY